jgi:1-acyl-sn-glycerol-3-phosphate acyltransferase
MREKIQAMMLAAIENGDSLILFPEGTRNLTDEILLPLKSGIFYLAKQRPNLEIVPVWLENLGRVMPKGALLPAPLLCSVKFGEAQQISTTDDKESFLQRLRMALLSLSIEGRQNND